MLGPFGGEHVHRVLAEANSPFCATLSFHLVIRSEPTAPSHPGVQHPGRVLQQPCQDRVRRWDRLARPLLQAQLQRVKQLCYLFDSVLDFPVAPGVVLDRLSLLD